MNRTLVIGLASLTLCACAGGTLSLQLTDAPPDTDQMSQVVVTLSRVEAHLVDKSEKKDGDPTDKSIDKDDKWVEVPLAQKEFDLLALQNDVTAALGDLELPEGKITQIRLFVDVAGRNEIVMKDARVCALDLNAVDQGGIKISHPFKAYDIEDGRQTLILVDFDVKESVSKEGDCLYTLAPVIKIKTEKSGIQ